MGGAVASQITKNYPDLIDAVLLWSPAGNISKLLCGPMKIVRNYLMVMPIMRMGHF